MAEASNYINRRIGNYLVIDELGRGNFSRVYRAKHIHLPDHTAAIKLLHAHLPEQERYRFLQEAGVLQMLKHLNIVSFFDFGILKAGKKNFPYLVTEYAPKGSLRDHLDEQLPHLMSIEDALTILYQVGQALQYAHDKGIVHRDLKPDNILFNANGEAMLADFGLATILKSASVRHGTIGGTPDYMAPEQFKGDSSKESDQYSLGCIAYELFTGSPPFTASSFFEFVFKHLEETPIAPRRLNAQLPVHIEQAILKAMSKERKDRYEDVSDFIIALNASFISDPESMISSPPQTNSIGDGPAFPLSSRSVEDHVSTVLVQPEEWAEVFPPVPTSHREGEHNQGSTVKKRGWRFGRRQKIANPEAMLPSPPQTNSIEDEPTHPLPDRPLAPSKQVVTENGTQAEHKDKKNQSGRNAALLGGAGLAAGLGLGALAAGEHGHGAAVPAGDEDWEALPAPSAGTGNGSSSSNAPRQAEAESHEPPSAIGTGNGGGPEIIAFPTPRPQGRITGKLLPAVVSVPPAQPHPPVVQSPGRRRNSGKIAAIGAAGAGAAMAARGAGAAALPPLPQIEGVGAAGPQRRHRRRWLAVATLILLTLLIIGGIVFAAPGGLGLHIFNGTPGATVTINPANTVVNGTYSIDAVPGGVTGNSQVAARILSSTKSQTGTINVTSGGHTPATTATGSLTFYNALTVSQTVAAGTILTGSDGVQVVNTQFAIIPAAQSPTEGFVTVPARAVQAGASGNIAALDINGACCLSGVTVRNSNAFTGGQDPQNYTVVSQNDVNTFANPLESTLVAAAKADVAGQKKTNEQFVGSVACALPTVSSSPAVGQAATDATVTVSVKCSGEVYDQAAAFALAQTSLKDTAARNAGASYALVGDILTKVKQANVVDSKGTVALLISAEGRWAYHFNDQQKQNLANRIKGKNRQDAINLLQQQVGVDGSKAPTINISIKGNTLPTDPAQINIVVLSVQGFTGTPTPMAGHGIPTGPGSTATPTPTPTPVNGL